MYNFVKKDDAKILEGLSKYLHKGVYQDFQKIKLIKICLYFSLCVIFISSMLSIHYQSEQIHFLKEVCRWCMNIVFSLLSYLMGRKQERESIKGKLMDETYESTNDNNEMSKQ